MFALTNIRYYVIFGFLLTAGIPAVIPAQIYFDTHEESKLWLEGTSTVHRFDCVARSIRGTAYIEGYGNNNPEKKNKPENSNSPNNTNNTKTSKYAQNGNVADHSEKTAPENTCLDNTDRRQDLHIHLKIPVKSFDCGRSRMNRDMFEALRSDQYDFITFEFEKARPIEKELAVHDAPLADGYTPFLIEGVLNVAGVDRHVDLIVRGRRDSDGRYRIKGHKEISMQDFGIDPPTALHGLIRAHDDLTVFFDLLVMEKHS